MMRLAPTLFALMLVISACTGATSEKESLPGEPPSPTAASSVTTTSPPASTTTTVAAASGSGATDDDTSRNPGLEGTTTSVPSVTPTTEPGPPPEGDPAPDFTLALGEDGAESFTLSEESKPVFLVFWAEW